MSIFLWWNGNVLLSRIYWRIWPPTTGDARIRSPRHVAHAVFVMCRRVSDGSIPIHFVDGVLCLECRAWVWSENISGRFREQQNNLFESRKNGEIFSDWITINKGKKNYDYLVEKCGLSEGMGGMGWCGSYSSGEILLTKRE